MIENKCKTNEDDDFQQSPPLHLNSLCEVSVEDERGLSGFDFIIIVVVIIIINILIYAIQIFNLKIAK